MVIPEFKKCRFETLVQGEARRDSLGPGKCLQKRWYPAEAAKLGEHVAMALTGELLESLSLGDDVVDFGGKQGGASAG